MKATLDPLRADPEFDADVLASWRAVGHALVAQHGAELHDLIELIGPLIAGGRYAAAAAAAQHAANHAVLWHPGRFASPTLERRLRELGEAALPAPGDAGRKRDLAHGAAILHVASRIGAIGGHSRMMSQWIAHDAENIHTVALTRQHEPVPPALRNAVSRSGGQVHRVNCAVGGLLVWARQLQSLLGQADLIVLHVHNMDVIPFLALAGMRQRPPLLLLNHADHLFWLGAGFVDLVVNTRRSGLRLCAERRGIPAARNMLLPLLVEPRQRQLPRAEAKRKLGLADDSVVILTVARALKFKSIGGAGFADALVPVLQADPRLRLIAVGPGGAVDWSKAAAAAPGQIVAFQERPDTATFFAAGDIYVDSFPFVSITSMFEAGLHGMPLVTRYPFGAGCEVLGADSPGLDGAIIRARATSDFQGAIRRLAGEVALRMQIGSSTQAQIQAVNGPEAWKRALARVYERVLELPRRRPELLTTDDCPSFADLDLFTRFVHGPAIGDASRSARLALATEIDFETLPPGRRLQAWVKMAWNDDFRMRRPFAAWRYLLPEWFACRARTLIQTMSGTE